MRGRHLDPTSTYKRGTSREHVSAYDREAFSGIFHSPLCKYFCNNFKSFRLHVFLVIGILPMSKNQIILWCDNIYMSWHYIFTYMCVCVKVVFDSLFNLACHNVRFLQRERIERTLQVNRNRLEYSCNIVLKMKFRVFWSTSCFSFLYAFWICILEANVLVFSCSQCDAYEVILLFKLLWLIFTRDHTTAAVKFFLIVGVEVLLICSCMNVRQTWKQHYWWEWPVLSSWTSLT